METENTHKFFSVYCFNTAWELMEKKDRSAEEDEEMVLLSHASIWHWTRRDDCEDANRSIGCWQASRIHAMLGRAEGAKHYARLALRYSSEQTPFLLAYANEAMARAEKVAGNRNEMAKYHAEAVRLAQDIEDANDRKLLLDDLSTLTPH